MTDKSIKKIIKTSILVSSAGTLNFRMIRNKVPKKDILKIQEEAQKFKTWYENEDFSTLFKHRLFEPGAFFSVWFFITEHANTWEQWGVRVPQRTDNRQKDFCLGLEFLTQIMFPWGIMQIKEGKSIECVIENLQNTLQNYREWTNPSYLEYLESLNNFLI